MPAARVQELTAILWDIQAQLELETRLVDRARLELADSSRSGAGAAADDTCERLQASLSAVSSLHQLVQGLLRDATTLSAPPTQNDRST